MRKFKYTIKNLNDEMNLMLDYHKEENNIEALNGAIGFYEYKLNQFQGVLTRKVFFDGLFKMFNVFNVIVLFGLMGMFICIGLLGIAINATIVLSGILYIPLFCVLFPIFILIEKKLHKDYKLFFKNFDIVKELEKLKFNRLCGSL